MEQRGYYTIYNNIIYDLCIEVLYMKLVHKLLKNSALVSFIFTVYTSKCIIIAFNAKINIKNGYWIFLSQKN